MGLFKMAKKWVDAGQEFRQVKNGVAGTAVITAAEKTGRSIGQHGDGVLDVRVDGHDPYELKLFHRVPSEDRPQVTVGIDVPIKALPPDPNEIAIDWANAS